MRIFWLPLLLVFLVTAQADDLDVIVDPKTSPEERGKAYHRLEAADFSSIASKLSHLYGNHPLFDPNRPARGLWPGGHANEPWNNTDLDEVERVGHTLGQLWNHGIEPLKDTWQFVDFQVKVLDDPDAGVLRYLAASEIDRKAAYFDEFKVKDSPRRDALFAHFDKMARDPALRLDVRLQLTKTLYRGADSNKYLDLAIALSEKADSLIRRGESFRDLTPKEGFRKLSIKNQQKYLEYGFGLLKQIDDGKSGDGYFLAMDLGHVVGVPPVGKANSPFAPDQSLPKYQDAHGLAKSFFQDTVNNAFKWWSVQTPEMKKTGHYSLTPPE